MAWNGRNESILGAKPISPVDATATVAASSAPTPKQASESSLNNDRNATASATATTTDTAGALPPQPRPPNAWNGRNAKIMEVRDHNHSNKEKVVPIVSLNTHGKDASTNTPSAVMMAVISKKPEISVENSPLCSSSSVSDVKSNNCIDNKKDDDIKTLSKEDETTSSTAGSSTTNTTIDEEPNTNTSPVMLEGNVVTTTVAVTNTTTAAAAASNITDSEIEVSNDKRNSLPPSFSADVKLPSRSNSADPNYSNSNSNNSRQSNHQQGRNNSSSSDHVVHHVRRGNNRGGGSSGSNRGNNNHNQSSSGKNNNSNKNNATRGNPITGGSDRRRVTKSEMPICSFFLQGLCTRGTSCNFRHDPTAAAAAATSVNTTVMAFPSSSSNNNKQSIMVSSDQSSSHYHSPEVITNNQMMNAMATTFVPNKRVFDPYKARAIQLAKEAQDEEDRSSYTSSTITKNISEVVEGAAANSEEKKTDEIEEPPFFSIDVECVATGYGSCARGINDGCGNEARNKEGVPSFQFNDRSHRYPGRVAMVDSDGNVLADIIIRPPKDGAGVLSYLTPLTGLTAELCLGEGAMSLEEAVDVIKAALPKNGVIVGQAIDHDVEWLGLTAGKDFGRTVDISDIFRQRMPCILNEAVNAIKKKEKGVEAATDGAEVDKSSDKYLGFATRYRHFSLRHVCLNLLGEDIQSGIHDPIVDAKYSLLLFHKYRNSSVTQLRIVRDGLHRAPATPGFAAEKSPVIEGVCVSRAGYPYKRAARKIWRWYSALKNDRQN